MVRFFGKEGAHVSIETLLDWVRAHPLGDGRIIPVMLWGGAGIGKTSQVKAYCAERGFEIITYHPAHDTDGGAIVGESVVDSEKGVTSYALPDWLPVEGRNKEKGVLFIDELNRANPAVLAGLMEVLGEGTISQSHWRLPRGWQIVCAANPREAGYQVNELDEAMVNRMLHYAPGWDAPEWVEWAQGAGIPEEVIDFVLMRRGEKAGGRHVIDVGEEQLPKEMLTKMRSTPRTVEYLAAVYEPGMDEGLLRVVSEGLLGREPAQRFREGLADEIRPLRADEIFAMPEGDEHSGYIYRCDHVLAQWGGCSAQEYQQLVAASVDRAIAHLRSKRPQRNEKTGEAAFERDMRAQLFGRFLAMLQPAARENALASIQRSAPQWFGPVQDAYKVWAQAFAKQRTAMMNQRLAPQVQGPVYGPSQQVPYGPQPPAPQIPGQPSPASHQLPRGRDW